jgi:hypothetical protein
VPAFDEYPYLLLLIGICRAGSRVDPDGDLLFRLAASQARRTETGGGHPHSDHSGSRGSQARSIQVTSHDDQKQVTAGMIAASA